MTSPARSPAVHSRHHKMSDAGADRRFYRIVRTNHPTEEDFKSHAASGKIPPRAIQEDAELLRSWELVSVFDTEDGARRVARASRDMRLGRYIAELVIASEGQDAIVIEKTRGSHGHHDIMAAPATLLALIVRIIPV